MLQNDEIKTVRGSIAGKPVTYETGRLAKQAGGAVLATMGGTVVLAAVTVSNSAKEGLDFFPLTVDYFEKMYAAGKIPGGFFKREGLSLIHISEPTRLGMISYAVFCLKKKKKKKHNAQYH